MRILYGVVGEGMGHAMRSQVTVRHLANSGHEVEIIASGRAVDYLKRSFENVRRVHGLHIVSEDNQVKKTKTVVSNAVAGGKELPANIKAYFKLVEEFEPELVVSDFESWTYVFAKLHRLPVISIDNMQIIHRARHDAAIVAGHEQNFDVIRNVVKAKLPRCDHYIITTFFYPELRKPETTLVPPILRPELLEAKPTKGEHLLVYQTAEGNEGLARALQELGLSCRVYGMRRNITEDQVAGALTYRPFSEAQFISDLASCRGVVASAGFTLMGEALHLKKPMLAVPLSGQFEQLLNARYLQTLGYGAETQQVDLASLKAFVANLTRYEERLRAYQSGGNARHFAALDHQLDRAAAGLL